MFLEHLAEMALVVKTEFGRNFRDAPLTRQEQAFRRCDTCPEQILMRTHAGGALKKTPEMKRAESGSLRYLPQLKPTAEARTDKEERAANWGGTVTVRAERIKGRDSVFVRTRINILRQLSFV